MAQRFTAEQVLKAIRYDCNCHWMVLVKLLVIEILILFANGIISVTSSIKLAYYLLNVLGNEL